jgi:hypothetical protein
MLRGKGSTQKTGRPHISDLGRQAVENSSGRKPCGLSSCECHQTTDRDRLAGRVDADKRDL